MSRVIENKENLILPDSPTMMNDVIYHMTQAYRLIIFNMDNAPLDDVIKLHSIMKKYSNRIDALINIISQET